MTVQGEGTLLPAWPLATAEQGRPVVFILPRILPPEARRGAAPAPGPTGADGPPARRATGGSDPLCLARQCRHRLLPIRSFMISFVPP